MKKFLHPCFVRVEDDEQRKELIEWLNKIGYDICSCVYFDGTIAIYVGEGRVHGILETDEFGCPHYDIAVYETKDSIIKDIDCGSDVEIFEAIAAINDEDDYMQWFICTCDYTGADGHSHYKGKMFRNDYPKFTHHLWRKSTSEEIIEHFTK